MNLEIELPVFMTPLMKKWLLQYKLEIINYITTLGLFHWEFRPNRSKPEKPRRIPRVGSGFSMARSNVAKEYIFEDEKFIEKNTLLNYIS